MATDYEVRSGDTLSKIASREGITLDKLLDLNPSLRSNPNFIRLGQNIRLSEDPRSSIFNVATSAKEASDNVTSSLMRGLTALREFADEANQSIYAGSQEFQSVISEAYSSLIDSAKSIPGAVADVKKAWDEDIKPRVEHALNVYPAITPAALRYVGLGDNTVVEDKIPIAARQALARIIAENEDQIRREGIQRYDLYQKYGGATDISGMNELPTDYGMDMAAKIIGGVSPSGFTFNEDGSVTVVDRYNVNLSTDFLEKEAERRLERSGGQNKSGAMLGNLEYIIQKARNAMASVRPDMYDYQLPSEGPLVNADERELTGYINRINLSAEEIQAAREGRQYIPDILGNDQQVSGLLSFLGDLSKPAQGGMRGF